MMIGHEPFNFKASMAAGMVAASFFDGARVTSTKNGSLEGFLCSPCSLGLAWRDGVVEEKAIAGMDEMVLADGGALKSNSEAKSSSEPMSQSGCVIPLSPVHLQWSSPPFTAGVAGQTSVYGARSGARRSFFKSVVFATCEPISSQSHATSWPTSEVAQ